MDLCECKVSLVRRGSCRTYRQCQETLSWQNKTKTNDDDNNSNNKTPETSGAEEKVGLKERRVRGRHHGHLRDPSSSRSHEHMGNIYGRGESQKMGGGVPVYPRAHVDT